MTTDEPWQETNQDIFDDYVRHILAGTSVDYIDESIEHIVETIEHGDAGPETALKLMAIAHVTFMTAHCSTRLNSMHDDEFLAYSQDPEKAAQPWALRLLHLIPRIGSALQKCVPLLEHHLPDDEIPPEDEWMFLIPTLLLPSFYSVPSLEKLKGKKLFGTKVGMDLILLASRFKANAHADDSSPDTNEKTKRTSLGHLADNLKLDLKPSIRSWPSWYWHLINSDITEVLSEAEPLDFLEWCSIVDFVADLMRQSEVWGETSPELNSEWGTENHYPAWSAENWAWQFGRVAALYSLVEVDMERRQESLDGWDNGLAAHSLLVQNPNFDWAREVDELWSGIYASEYNRLGSEEQAFQSEDFLLPSMQLPTSRFYWLMRLGFLAGKEELAKPPAMRWTIKDGVIETKEVPKHTGTQELTSPTSGALRDDAFAILPQELSKTIDESVLQAVDAADYRREEVVRSRLSSHLGEIVELVSDDAMDALVAGEFALSLSPMRRPRRISLDYAVATEIALEDMLQRPRSQNEWPGSDIGAWCDVLRKMSRPQKERRHSLDRVVRDRFDAKHASILAERLDILRKLRPRDAHQSERPPRLHQVRDAVLGTETSPSIFEVILRFAKKWPPK